MAIMIPEKPHEYDPSSQEGIIFDALKMLSDEYFVIHSMKIATINNNVYQENEGDFIVFHPQKGIICIEAKAGKVKYDGTWKYGNGIEMPHGGPFRQAENFKWRIIQYIQDKNRNELIKKCKFLHAVWFVSLASSDLDKIVLPSECVREQILTKEALKNPSEYIDKIFNISIKVGGETVNTKLSQLETKIMIRDILCPEFEIVPASSFDLDIKKIVFHHLLAEQTNVLNFLVEQKSAVINGAAGTGKTLIALEKARREAEFGDRVLFLCYNNQLKSYISDNYPNERIDYYTIDGFACKTCNTEEPDYSALAYSLMEMYEDNSFPYKHIVVDEGQDFGIEMIDGAGVLDLLREIVIEKNGGTFYVFYDNLQLIQAKKMPDYISQADCKLTLYRNCRNTVNIAKTSLKPITERKPTLTNGAVSGKPATLHYCKSSDSAIETIDETIEKLKAEGINDIVLLTCKTEQKSIISDFIENGTYKNIIRFSTCRRFKGLEADAVILIDVDEDTFANNNVLLFYVGTSRARYRLDIITMIDNDGCTRILNERFGVIKKIKQPKKEFATILNTVGRNN